MKLRMPAESAPHERCLMAWPGVQQVPNRDLAEARRAHAEIARVLNRFEPVLMLAYPGFGRQAEHECRDGVEVLEIALGTVWVRDTGPIFAIRDSSELVALDFRFNSWGRTLPPYRSSLAGRLCPRLGVERIPVDVVLEGGAIAVDGAGTLVAVESAVLDERRNPGRTRADLEAVFATYLGIERTVWLPAGLADDKPQHADNVVAFVAPGRILSQVPEHRPLLAAAGLDVVPFDLPPSPIRYLNFYVGNGCVLVPTAGNGNDERALSSIGEHFPDREVVGVPGLPLAEGGGGVHCITQQVPRV